MGISRVTNTDDRRVAHVVDEDGRPQHTVLLHQESKASGNMVVAPLPSYLRDPRWDGERWREAHTVGSVVRILLWFVLLAACLVFLVTQGHAQNNDNIAKVGGVNQSGDNVIDTTNHAVKVNIVAGGGTGGGPSDAAANAAASESDTARQKDISAIRLLDTSQAAGSQLVTAKGDQTSGAWVNCKAGCSSAADTTGSTVALGSLNANALVALVGTNSASVFISGGGNLVGTIVPEVSNDGGTTWFTTFFEDPATHALTTSQAVSSPAATMLGILLPGGADRARVRVSVYTSGSTNATLKAVAQFPNRPIKVSSLGVVSVDGSAVTQPVSGTFWQATQPVSGTFWQATQPVSGTFWQATQPVSGTFFQATQPVSEADGANVTLGAKADAKSTATDNTAITIMQVLKQISASVQAPPSQAVTNAGTFADQATLQTQTDTVMVGGVNVKEINGVTPLMGNGTTGTGSQRVTIASDNTAFAVNATLSAETTKVIGTVRNVGNAGANFDAATGAAPPANGVLAAGITSGATGGFLAGIPISDTYKVINVSTATTTLLVTGVSGRQVRIGSINLLTAGANNVALIEGTGATCGTGSAGMTGGTTAASGWNFAANGGIAFGTGLGTVMQTATTGDSVCIVTSASVQLSGGLQYTIY